MNNANSSHEASNPNNADAPVVGFRRAYAATLIPESPWTRLSSAFRRRLIYGIWVVTWFGLLAGMFDSRFFEYTIALTVVHSIGFLALLRFRPMVFPTQLRIAYVGWLVLGTFVPFLGVMMHITLVGLGANLIWGYCPLARMLYLLPWNRQQPLSLELAWRAFFTAPKPGRFKVELARRASTTAVQAASM